MVNARNNLIKVPPVQLNASLNLDVRSLFESFGCLLHSISPCEIPSSFSVLFPVSDPIKYMVSVSVAVDASNLAQL
jgi:hypothetical protein